MLTRCKKCGRLKILGKGWGKLFGRDWYCPICHQQIISARRTKTGQGTRSEEGITAENIRKELAEAKQHIREQAPSDASGWYPDPPAEKSGVTKVLAYLTVLCECLKGGKTDMVDVLAATLVAQNLPSVEVPQPLLYEVVLMSRVALGLLLGRKHRQAIVFEEEVALREFFLAESGGMPLVDVARLARFELLALPELPGTEDQIHLLFEPGSIWVASRGQIPSLTEELMKTKWRDRLLHPVAYVYARSTVCSESLAMFPGDVP